MFHKGHFILRLFGALLLIAALVGGGALLFRAGQAQGYAIGLANSAAEQLAPGANPAPGAVPGPFYGYGYYRPHFMPFFAPFGFLGGGLIVLFFFLFVGGIFRMFAWRRHAMWHTGYGSHGPWSGGPHPWGGPTPPWASQPGDPNKPAQAQPTEPPREKKD
jgi:hypothetical protein